MKTLPVSLSMLVLCLISACSDGGGRDGCLQSRIESAAQDIVTTQSFPGMTVAIVKGDDSYSVAVGFSNRETQRTMTTDTPMLAASIGKTFVAASVLRLAAQGTLSVDSPIADWLGQREWFARLPNGHRITTRHLLQHTSGLPDHVHVPEFAALGLDAAARLGPEAMIALVFDQQPLFLPGEGWSYSDTGYLLLGLIIEQAAGVSYGDYLRSHFLHPLGLRNTGLSDRIDIDGLARGYVSPASGFNLPVRTTDDDGKMLWDPGVEWTGGGLFSTSEDLARWGRRFLSGDLLGTDALHQATDSMATVESAHVTHYGLGVSIRLGSPWGTIYGHRGWIPGYVSSLQYYPDFDTAIAFQINSDIGIVDADRPLIREIEERLAAIVFGVE